MNLKDVVIGALSGPILFVIGINIWGYNQPVAIVRPIEEETLSLCEYGLEVMEIKYVIMLKEIEELNDRLDKLHQ